MKLALVEMKGFLRILQAPSRTQPTGLEEKHDKKHDRLTILISLCSPSELLNDRVVWVDLLSPT